MSIKSENLNICSFLDCSENIIGVGNKYCEHHNNGGIFGNGETYEQYQIIEKDFLDFIKIVPINDPNHLTVHSPVLRDIIIRCCVQIEFFFKEWSLYKCSELKNWPEFAEYDIWKEYIKPKKNEFPKTYLWNIRSYFFLKDLFTDVPIYVRPMNQEIKPFGDWTNKMKCPEWWNSYNEIKHRGQSAKEKANLKNALYALSALFYLHCENEYTNSYLKQFGTFYFVNKLNQVSVQFDSITTPIDSKQYLFRYNSNSPEKKIELVSKQQIDQSKRKGLL